MKAPVLVPEPEADTSDPAALESSLAFWDNPVDDALYNAPPDAALSTPSRMTSEAFIVDRSNKR